MRTGVSIQIPAGMLFRKFYCHRCGERLKRQAKKRIVTPQDPDWHKHNRVGRIQFFEGDVEVTEYDFCCPCCGQITTYDAQVQYRYIQKKHDTSVLSQALLRQELPWATEKWERKKALGKMLGVLGCVVLVVVILMVKRLLNG